MREHGAAPRCRQRGAVSGRHSAVPWCREQHSNKNKDQGPMPERPIEADAGRRWRPVYRAVVVYTVVIIVLLCGFSRWFSG